MKRIFLTSCALGAAALMPMQASAEPGIVYIPTEEITLTPFNEGPCGSSTNSALGCYPVDGEVAVPPFGGDLDGLMVGLETAVADFDVLVTNERPPEYVGYTMMLPDVSALFQTSSLSCTFGGVNCSALKRNDFAFLVDATQNCMMPDLVHQAVFAFGRSAGLDGVMPPEDMMAPLDVMTFPPDYTMPLATFTDQCLNREHHPLFDDMGVPAGEDQLDCTSLDQAVECPDDADGDPGQNSYQNLLAYYGARTEDADAPVLSDVSPEDGTVLQQGDDLVLGVTIADADPIVGARWVVQSQALEDAGVAGGILSQCTNDVCTSEWPEGTLKPTDSDWSFTLVGLPAGEYVVTLEAADYHGNEAEMLTINVTIEGGASADTGTGNATNDTNDTNDTNETNSTNPFGDSTGTDDSNGSSTTGQDEDTSGCSCRTTSTPAGAMWMMLGLVGLGAMRRRW